ncbi:hypothetical protein ACFFX0_02835 [Citricoccus parietis]|uniref:Uncharacterized protein n=1 Tax=Citricoccus parietis TaxID=592307 RepID=A0ABV5FU24_9MICC
MVLEVATGVRQQFGSDREGLHRQVAQVRERRGSAFTAARGTGGRGTAAGEKAGHAECRQSQGAGKEAAPVDLGTDERGLQGHR